MGAQRGQREENVKLKDIVKALVNDDDISVSENDIVETVEFLVAACQKPRSVFKIGKIVNEAIEYEKD